MGSGSELRITFSVGPIALLIQQHARFYSNALLKLGWLPMVGSQMDILEIMYVHKAIGLLRCGGEGAALTKGC